MFYSTCNKQKEKDVKTHRKQLEKKWRKEILQLDQLREQEGHGKIELGVGHQLALGPPTDENQPDEIESVPTTPLFATQPLVNERDNVSSPSDRGISSSCDSWAEQDIGEVILRKFQRFVVRPPCWYPALFRTPINEDGDRKQQYEQ